MGVLNFQNGRTWVVNRVAADIKDGIRQKRKFPQKVMVWLSACSKGVSSLVIFESGTLDHEGYINEVPLVTLKSGDDTPEIHWIFQQDGAKSHIYAKPQK